MIGIGLDAVTEDLFRRIRTDVPAGGAGLSWAKYWEVVNDAREIFGPWKVNCHTLVGLGETDRRPHRHLLPAAGPADLLLPVLLQPRARLPHGRPPQVGRCARWRRIQLAKHLIETEGFDRRASSTSTPTTT